MSAPFRPFPSASIAVHKYGGSSVATPELIRKVAARVASCRKDGQKNCRRCLGDGQNDQRPD
ncbi:aspartate kinase domain protein [Jonquetella sp. BV3C21]|nr:aspartate kinase domain protein [Jonquetella sp. BV3C21]